MQETVERIIRQLEDEIAKREGLILNLRAMYGDGKGATSKARSALATKGKAAPAKTKRNRGWTPERRKKFRATLARKRAAEKAKAA